MKSTFKFTGSSTSEIDGCVAIATASVSYDQLSVLRKCKFTIGMYKYTCVMHYVSMAMADKYIDDLTSDVKRTKGDTGTRLAILLDHAMNISEAMRKLRKWKAFIYYWTRWLMKPRFPEAKINATDVNYEFHTYQAIISNDRITEEMIIKYHEDAYWMMMISTRGLAVSIANMSLRCKFENLMPYEHFIKHRICTIIEGLRDRYIEQTLIPLVESTRGSLVVHMITSEMRAIKPSIMAQSSMIRRYVHVVSLPNTPEIRGDEEFVSGIEGSHIDYIKLYRMIERRVDLSMGGGNLGSSVSYTLFMDMIQVDRGVCFAVVAPDSIPSDADVRGVLIQAIERDILACEE